MNTPIQPPAPVNPVVTIQPVTTAVPNREGAPANPLANIALGTSIEGFVVNRDAQNNPIVRTALGDLRVTSEVFLKTGSEVVFKVDASQPTLARIISVDGLTPQEYEAQNIHTTLRKDTISTSGLPQNARLLPGGGLDVARGTPILQALVLQTAEESLPTTAPTALRATQTAPTPMIAQLAQLRVGSPVRLTVVDIKLPPLPISLAGVPENEKLEGLLPAARPATATPNTLSTNTAKNIQIPIPTTPGVATSVSVATAKPTPFASPLPATQQALSPNIVHTLAQTPPLPIRTPLSNTSTIANPIEVEAPLPPTTYGAPLKAELIAHYSKTTANLAPVLPASSPTSANAARPVASQSPIANHAAPMPSNVVEATVIGHEADGANILHTSFATLKLYTPQPLPTGTTLTVHAAPEHMTPATGVPQAATSEEAITLDTEKPWKTLEEAIATLKQANPEIAQEVMQRLPSLNQKLASGLLFFIVAIKGGNIQEVIGKRATRLLELSAPDLLGKLRKEVGQLQSFATASPLPHWSLIYLPMMLGQELHTGRLYIGKDPESENTGTGSQGRGQRFVLEVGMSSIGKLQLDGFVRQESRAKQFDLLIRSERTLDTSLKQGINDIFYNSMQVTGMQGTMQFQVGARYFVHPEHDNRPLPDSLTSNTILA